VAVASLASYDRTASTLVDTNIWIDCIDASSPWHGLSSRRETRRAERRW
jgi:hypothetical protein